MNVDLLNRLMAAGTPMDLIAEVAAELGRAEADRLVLAERRAKDRERKRPRNSAETAEVVEIHSAKGGLDSPPNERNLTPPLIPQKLVVVEDRADEVGEVFAEWNRAAKQLGMRTGSKLTSERRSRARARLAEHGREAFTEAIRRAGASAFCRGENDRGWKADFDFLVQPQSFLGLIEGKYDDRTPHRSANRPGAHRRTAADLLGDLRMARMGG